jgi:hypothetical protein
MRKKWLLVYFILSSLSLVYAQDKKTIRGEQNPFSEARFNYFKETIILFNEYLDTKNGSFNTTNFRILKPIGNRAWTIRFDAPLISTNSSTLNKSGVGDISFASSYIPYLTKKSGIATRLRITTNSANNPSFGSGKWVISPAIFYGTYINKSKKLLLISDFEYQYSIAGSENRADIRTTVLESTMIYSFAKNWISSNVALRYNQTRKGFQNSTFAEFGRKLTPDSLFYIHPSLAFGDQKSYNYGIELGVVILY